MLVNQDLNPFPWLVAHGCVGWLREGLMMSKVMAGLILDNCIIELQIAQIREMPLSLQAVYYYLNTKQ